MRARTLRLSSYLLGMIMSAGIAGCAPVKPPHSPPEPSQVTAGTILSMRSVYSPAAADAMRAALLGSGSTPEKVSHPLTEFIVRTDDGPMMSIIQTNEPGFHVGDRVIILHRDRTQLAPPPT